MQTTIGPIQIEADHRGLRISQADDPSSSCLIAPDYIGELIEFVLSLAVDGSYKRRAFRIPVLGAQKLDVFVHIGEQRIQVRAHDISVVGMFVSKLDPDDFHLQRDDCVDIELQLNDAHAKCCAIVSRQQHDGYGLYFRDSIVSGELRPPESLNKIVMRLQREWIKYRNLETQGTG